MGFPGGSDGKEFASNAGDPGLTPGSGRSPGGGNGNPLQYSCLGNPMDRGAWRATVRGVAESNMTELLMNTHRRRDHSGGQGKVVAFLPSVGWEIVAGVFREE